MRWSFLVVFCVLVAGFAAASLCSTRQARIIDEDSATIALQAAPSIQRLAAARVVLHRIEASTRLLLADADRPMDRPLDADWRELHDQLSAYVTAPSDGIERQAVRELDASLAALENLVGRVLLLSQRGERPDARELARAELRPRQARTHAAMQQLVARKAQQIEALSFDIMKVRRRMTVIGWALDALALLAAAVGLLLVARTVRAWLNLEQERRRMAERRADDLGHFAERVAHDLKGPLTAIMLRLGLDGEPTRDGVALLGRQLRSMNKLIDGLLELSLADAPDVTRRCRPAEALDEVMAMVAAEARAAGVELRVSVVAGGDVACSSGALISVLSNLTRNAIKFLDGCPVRRVTVSVEERRERVRIEVADTGPGIPPGHEEAIFEPLVRLSRSRARPGWGLGLATVKRIVSSCGGSVGVVPNEGGGARFWVELPRAAEAMARASA